MPLTCEALLNPSLGLYPSCLQSSRRDLDQKSLTSSALTLPTATAPDLRDLGGHLWHLSAQNLCFETVLQISLEACIRLPQ